MQENLAHKKYNKLERYFQISKQHFYKSERKLHNGLYDRFG